MKYTAISHQLVSHDEALACQLEQEIIRYQDKQRLDEMIVQLNLRELLEEFFGILPLPTMSFIEVTFKLGEPTDVK